MFRAAAQLRQFLARRVSRFITRFWEESSILRHYSWKYRRLVGIGLVALVIVDVTEILPPLFLKQAVDVTVAGGPPEALLRIALLFLAVACVQSVCRYGWRMYLLRASMLGGRDLRSRFAHDLLCEARQVAGRFRFEREQMPDLRVLRARRLHHA